jgi:hypothetical protein
MKSIAYLATAAAALLFAGTALAGPFGVRIPGLEPAPPKPEKPAPPPAGGVYFIQETPTAVYLVDSTTIATSANGRRSADVYVLDHLGANRRDADDFDCTNHRVKKTGGFEFKLNADDSDVIITKSPGWTDEHYDPDGTVIRVTEEFVCYWPRSAVAQVLVTGMPDDEHDRMLKLGKSAKEMLGPH